MTITSGVSFMGQTIAQSERLKDVQVAMADIQRQVATQKKYDTLAGLGSDTHFVLQLHADQDQLSAYNANIGSAFNRINVMNGAMNEVGSSLTKIITTLQSQPGNGNYDMATIRQQAQQLLDYVADLANTNIAGRYLFAGTDTSNAPLPDKAALVSNVQGQLTDWLDGTVTTNQLIANTDGFTGTSLGFSASVSGAADVSTHIDKNVNFSYGAVADRSGIQDAVRVLSMLASIQTPNPATDIPTGVNLDTVMDHLLNVALSARDQVQDSQTSLSSKLDLVKSIQATHTQTINTYATMLEDKENADPAEVITLLQALQTQLTAAFEVTRMVSQLSLANFLN